MIKISFIDPHWVRTKCFFRRKHTLYLYVRHGMAGIVFTKKQKQKQKQKNAFHSRAPLEEVRIIFPPMFFWFSIYMLEYTK